MSVNNNFSVNPFSNFMDLESKASISLTNTTNHEAENRNLPEKSLIKQKRRIEVDDDGESLPAAKRIFTQQETTKNQSQGETKEGSNFSRSLPEDYWNAHKAQKEPEENGDTMSWEPTNPERRISLFQEGVSQWQDQIPEELVSMIGTNIASSKEYRSFLEQFPLIKEFRSLERAEQIHSVFSKYYSNNGRFGPTHPFQYLEFDNRVLGTILDYSDSVTSRNLVIGIGEEEWNELGINPGIVPPIPYEELIKPCPFWKGLITAQTHLLALIPDITLSEFLKILMNKKGIVPKFVGRVNLEEDDKKKVSAHWILIPKDVIPNSRSKTYDEQKAMLDAFPGYKMPRVRDVMITCLMEYLRRGKRMFDKAAYHLWTYTRCEEKIEDDRFIVGDFGNSGLNCHRVTGARDACVGLACVREFF